MTAPVQQCQPDSEHTPTPWMQVALHPEYILGDGQLAGQSFSIKPDITLMMRDPLAAKALAEANAAFIVEAVNSHAALKSQVEELDRTIDLLESNARVQAKLLADTGRKAEELTKALIDAKLQIEYVQEKHGYATGETVLARIRSVLSLEDRK